MLFIHIPKTAGGTLNSIIAKQYPQAAVFQHRVYENDVEEKKAVLLQALNDDIRVIRGHYFYGIHEHLTRPYQYITILRDPIDRMISSYYFYKERPQHPNYASTNAVGIEEFYDRNLDGTFQENRQTRMIAGFDQPDQACTPEVLQQAIDNMERNIAIVGLTERFDESLILIRRAFNWGVPLYYKHNESSRPSFESVSEATKASLRKHNEYDVQLYDHAQKLFEQQLSRQGNDYWMELRTFKVLNALYATPFYIARRIKRTASA